MISLLSQISICPIYPRLDNFSSGVNGIKLPSTLDTTASNSLLTLTGLTNDLPIRHFSETVKLHSRQLHDPIQTITVMGAMMHPPIIEFYQSVFRRWLYCFWAQNLKLARCHAILYNYPSFRYHWHWSTCSIFSYVLFLMSCSQTSNERMQQQQQQSSSIFPSFRVNKQRAAIWFSKPSFFRFKNLKSGFLSHSSSSSSSSSSKSKSSSSSSVFSLPRSQSPSTMTLKDSIHASNTSVSNQPGACYYYLLSRKSTSKP